MINQPGSLVGYLCGKSNCTSTIFCQNAQDVLILVVHLFTIISVACTKNNFKDEKTSHVYEETDVQYHWYICILMLECVM